MEIKRTAVLSRGYSMLFTLYAISNLNKFLKLIYYIKYWYGAL
jgi:hypothetical protein